MQLKSWSSFRVYRLIHPLATRKAELRNKLDDSSNKQICRRRKKIMKDFMAAMFQTRVQWFLSCVSWMLGSRKLYCKNLHLERSFIIKFTSYVNKKRSPDTVSNFIARLSNPLFIFVRQNKLSFAIYIRILLRWFILHKNVPRSNHRPCLLKLADCTCDSFCIARIRFLVKNHDLTCNWKYLQVELSMLEKERNNSQASCGTIMAKQCIVTVS